MNNDNQIIPRLKYKSNVNDIIVVSLFYDLGIINKEEYIENLIEITTKIGHKLVIFIDERYLQLLYENVLIQDKIKNNLISIIPINEEWLLSHTIAWQTLQIIKMIMASNLYKERVKSYMYPELMYPKYNALVHCKVDLIRIASKILNIQNVLYCWIDIEKKIKIENNYLFKQNKLPSDKISFLLSNVIKPKDFDAYDLFLNKRKIINTSFYTIPNELIENFHTTYFDCMRKLHIMGICDDDAHIYLRCISHIGFQYFQLYLDTEPNGLTYFNKDNSVFNWIDNCLNELDNKKKTYCCECINKYTLYKKYIDDNYTQFYDILFNTHKNLNYQINIFIIGGNNYQYGLNEYFTNSIIYGLTNENEIHTKNINVLHFENKDDLQDNQYDIIIDNNNDVILNNQYLETYIYKLHIGGFYIIENIDINNYQEKIKDLEKNECIKCKIITLNDNHLLLCNKIF